jgi:hypothetical protein
MNALALARLDDPLVGSKHALRRSDFLRTLASGVNSSQPANDVGEKSSSYDEHASGSLFWTQKDPTRFAGGRKVFLSGPNGGPSVQLQPTDGAWTAVVDSLANGGTSNLYVYGGDDPVNREDPNGEGFFGTVSNCIEIKVEASPDTCPSGVQYILKCVTATCLYVSTGPSGDVCTLPFSTDVNYNNLEAPECAPGVWC